ncbi:uncharacterized protein LOC124805348 isoform X2 [Schistocerca piceifrons]|uniref:uncharacterized protein LOC124805348 isoform X2 n=1 Tax=Schistocerca piceifrons TaxID=274613 RepID=UPI001F5FB2A7|nr:uncharacterized protein LOC124805348 isoform X2 [Schistocerca piceifrons]
MLKPNDAVVLRLSAPIKKYWAESKGLDFDQLLGTGAYKENYRLEMIRWGESVRARDPGYFCQRAIEMSNGTQFSVWIVSDTRRLSDLKWFLDNCGGPSVVHTVRVVADDAVRKQRGWMYTPGSRSHGTARPLPPPDGATRAPQEEQSSPFADPMDLDPSMPSPSPPSPQDMPSDLDICHGSSFSEDAPFARWWGIVERMPSSTATAPGSSLHLESCLSPFCRSQPHYMTMVQHFWGGGGGGFAGIGCCQHSSWQRGCDKMDSRQRSK